MLTEWLARVLRRRGGLLLGLVAIAFAAIPQALAPLDRWLYDLVVQYPKSPSSRSQTILAQYQADQAPSRQQLQQLLPQFAAAGAKLLVVVDLQADPTSKASAPMILAPIRVGLVDGDGDGIGRWLSPEQQTEAKSIWCWPKLDAGVAREMPATILLNGKQQPCVAVAVAAALRNKPPTQRGYYGIDFSLPRDSLQRYDWVRLREREYPANALANRVVIVAPAREYHMGIATPLGSGTEAMALAELQARALDTLLWGSQVRVAPLALVLAIAVLLYFVLYGWLLPLTSAFPQAPLLLVCALLLVFGAALGLWLGRYWLAPGLPVFAIALTGWARQFDLRTHEQSLLVRLQRALGSLANRRTAAEPVTSTAPYQQIADFLAQCFDLQRCLVLSVSSDGRRVEQIAGHNATVDDVFERRRDIEREPYTTAIAAGRPIRIERSFLAREADGEGADVEFLAPLAAGGRAIGFWFYTLTPEVANSERAPQPKEVEQIIEELTQLVLAAGRNAEREDRERARLPFAGRRSVLTMLHSGLDRSLHEMQVRFATFEDLFDNATSPAAVVDSFGRVRLANHAFEELARRTRQPLLGYNTIEILTGCCNIEVSRAREILREVLLGGDGVDLTADGVGGEERYVLRVRPLRGQATEPSIAAGRPFKLLGVLLEFTGGAAPMLANESVDVQRMLEECVADLRERAAARGARVALNCGEVGTTPVPADRLRIIVRVICDILLEDVIPDSQIRLAAIRLLADEPRIVITAHNQGYGLPQWHIEELMTAAEHSDGPLGRLAKLRQELARWGGDIEVSAEVASGFAITVSVPTS